MLRMIQYLKRRLRRSASCAECGARHTNRNKDASFTAFCGDACFDSWARDAQE